MVVWCRSAADAARGLWLLWPGAWRPIGICFGCVRVWQRGDQLSKLQATSRPNMNMTSNMFKDCHSGIDLEGQLVCTANRYHLTGASPAP